MKKIGVNFFSSIYQPPFLHVFETLYCLRIGLSDEHVMLLLESKVNINFGRSIKPCKLGVWFDSKLVLSDRDFKPLSDRIMTLSVKLDVKQKVNKPRNKLTNSGFYFMLQPIMRGSQGQGCDLFWSQR